MILEDELKLKVFSQAGQVALEFLRGKSGQGISKNSKETIKDYNEVFEETFQHMTDVVGNTKA